jgi:hypothetical protein
MANLKPNEQRAKNAILLIWIVLALEAVNFISSFFQYHLLQTIANGGYVSDAVAAANDTREGIAGILYTVAFIISAVTFILWFRRAYYNLHQKVSYLADSDGWAAGSWFVPIMNLYRPYQIMKELYLETKELFIKKEMAVNQNFTTRLVGWWWTLWIINNIIGNIVFRYSLKAESIGELTTSTVVGMISNVVGIVLALITVKVIKDYAQVEPLLREISDEEETTIRLNL